MPNINEFFHKPELLHKAELEKIQGLKPCSQCDSSAQEAFWDPVTMILAWECENGHKSQFKVN